MRKMDGKEIIKFFNFNYGGLCSRIIKKSIKHSSKATEVKKK